MSRFLGLNSAGQWSFFNRLIKDGLVYRTNVATIKEKVFLLTRDGGELAGILAGGEKINYLTDERRIRVGTFLHNLCVQLAVIKRLKDGMNHNFEKQLYFTDRDKLPDALLTLGDHSTALEIELSHKNTNHPF
jgi:hypothetical protein